MLNLIKHLVQLERVLWEEHSVGRFHLSGHALDACREYRYRRAMERALFSTIPFLERN
jgi:hypothetical protein